MRSTPAKHRSLEQAQRLLVLSLSSVVSLAAARVVARTGEPATVLEPTPRRWPSCGLRDRTAVVVVPYINGAYPIRRSAKHQSLNRKRLFTRYITRGKAEKFGSFLVLLVEVSSLNINH